MDILNFGISTFRLLVQSDRGSVNIFFNFSESLKMK